jgi:protoheme IX farnesyltransferase
MYQWKYYVNVNHKVTYNLRYNSKRLFYINMVKQKTNITIYTNKTVSNYDIILPNQIGQTMSTSTSLMNERTASLRDYFELCKPRVVALMILTSIVGMCLASPGLIPWRVFIFGNLGIALAAGSAAAINHLADYHIDRIMARTHGRPVPTGKVAPIQALLFASILCIIAITMLAYFVNTMTAVLTFLSTIAYAGVYTYYLKHATSQNIVIGGIAGATPPLLGWVAVTNHISAMPIILTLIIFVWTPPHFWALAIARVDDYAKAKVPMLPNTHGIHHTKVSIIFYTILLFAATLLPFTSYSCGWIYVAAVTVLNIRFLQWVIRLYRTDSKVVAMKTFKFSIVYLMYLFVALLVDHYWLVFSALH